MGLWNLQAAHYPGPGLSDYLPSFQASVDDLFPYSVLTPVIGARSPAQALS